MAKQLVLERDAGLTRVILDGLVIEKAIRVDLPKERPFRTVTLVLDVDEITILDKPRG